VLLSTRPSTSYSVYALDLRGEAEIRLISIPVKRGVGMVVSSLQNLSPQGDMHM